MLRAYSFSEQVTMALTPPFSIATLNVRGLAARRRQSQLYRLLTDQDIDVLAVQETKVDGEEETGSMVRRFTDRYYAVVSHSIGTSAGCVLFVKKLQGLLVQSVFSCQSGRIVYCDFVYGATEFRVICVYAPNSVEERAQFFSNLFQWTKCDKRVVLLGDFNCVLRACDRVNSTGVRDKSSDVLGKLITENDLEDVYECVAANREVIYTRFHGNSHARLDRIYLSLDVLPMCHDFSVEPVSFSDHCLVVCRIGMKKQRKVFNWDLWKLNALLLKDEPFLEAVHETINEVLMEKTETVAEKWECLKQKVKMKALDRSSTLKFEAQIKERSLKKTLQQLIALESREPGTCKDEVRSVKEKLELHDRERYRGAWVRARANDLAAGETPTKRALGLEKAQGRRNHIDKVYCNGTLASDNESIERAFAAYYQSLFAIRKANVHGFKEEFLKRLPRLSDDTKKLLEGRITEGEVERAIGHLNPGKSPGPDGLTAAWYKTFRIELSPGLAELFNEAYERKTLPPSFSKAHTILIPKTDEGEKLKLVTSYRPISLTNVDYKIFMKVLAARLQGVIKEIVGEHQTCGIKGRTISSNIHKMRCVLECCDEDSLGVAVLQIDLEKAFDCVAHDILFVILDHINVGSIIKEGVALAYQNCTTRLIVNKSLGAPIHVMRSVRQGCPLSPLLFCIYIEAMCLAINENEKIRGFSLAAVEVKLLAYADDIAVCCTNKESVEETISVVKHFCSVTGSRVNWAKSLGLWHGRWPSKPDLFANVHWTETPTRYLGVPLECYNGSEEYWSRQTKETKEKADRWKGMNLSVFARATVCNMFFIAKLWYVMQVLHCSRINVQRLHRVFAVFIWGSKWERCRRTNLFRRVKDGGLGLAHLFVRQVVNRFLFFRDVRDPFLRTVCQLRLGSALPDFVVTTDSRPVTLRGYLKEVVDSVRFLSVRFSIDYLASVRRKELYKDVCAMVLPVPLYRAIYSGRPGQNVLKRVRNMQVPTGVKTFFFKLHTGTLSVKTFTEERGFFTPWGSHCLICKKPETIDHVFLHCWEGVHFWDILQRTIKKDFPLDPHGIRYLAVTNDDGVPFDVVMLTGLHCIWRARMAGYHFDPDAKPAVIYFRQSMSAFIECSKIGDIEPEWLSRFEPLANLKYF